MESFKLVAMGCAMALWSGVASAQNNCGNQATPPKIASTAIVSPRALTGLGDASGGWKWRCLREMTLFI